jgi:phenolic acid decarboxylase
VFLLVVVLKHGQTIQLPKETWTDNTTTKRNMDRQYNDQKKHGQTMQRPKETWTGNTTTKRNMDRQYNVLEVVLSVHVSFGRCIVCPCFFWSLYFLSMFLLVVVLPVHVSLGRPKETWTDNTTTKRNMDRQYNDQKKHGQAIQRPKETWTDNTTTKRNMDACSCFFW